ncbi:MAG: hypothetical protein ABUT39_20975 [Acidobacteriota bacterium]
MERFASGRTSPAENRSLVAHLLKGCNYCSRRLASLLRPEVSPSSYDRMFNRLEISVGDTWSAMRHEDFGSLFVEAR